MSDASRRLAQLGTRDITLLNHQVGETWKCEGLFPGLMPWDKEPSPVRILEVKKPYVDVLYLDGSGARIVPLACLLEKLADPPKPRSVCSPEEVAEMHFSGLTTSREFFNLLADGFGEYLPERIFAAVPPYMWEDFTEWVGTVANTAPEDLVSLPGPDYRTFEEKAATVRGFQRIQEALAAAE